VQGVTPDAMAARTTENFRRLFPKTQPLPAVA
jgi:hypothetical protein